jgi:hypothetical protein
MRLIRGLGLVAVNISSCALLVYDMALIFCCFMFYGILWNCSIKKLLPVGRSCYLRMVWLEKLLHYNLLCRLLTTFGVDDFKGIETFFEVVDAGIAGGYIHELVHNPTGIVHHEDVQLA